LPNFSIEQEFNLPIIGIDEVGRGPLAGPVVSCAFIFFDKSLEYKELYFINDSKKLSSKKRIVALQEIYKLKKEKKIKYCLGMASVKEIDEFNILEATKISMRRAVKKLQHTPSQLIIDGNIDLKLEKYPSRSVIKGDQKSYSIAAASIVAKIHRDRYMQFLSYKWPFYNWSSNAGYGTKQHIEQIKKKGITIHHRKSFEPIKTLIHSK
jgi:ribonuclease HII|tara:strand:+ start:1321 stop:1947 length:627 start_codon:yes stop_codon:yes gene_type:complete